VRAAARAERLLAAAGRGGCGLGVEPELAEGHAPRERVTLSESWLVETGVKGVTETRVYEFPTERLAEAFAQSWALAAGYWADVVRDGAAVAQFGSKS